MKNRPHESMKTYPMKSNEQHLHRNISLYDQINELYGKSVTFY